MSVSASSALSRDLLPVVLPACWLLGMATGALCVALVWCYFPASASVHVTYTAACFIVNSLIPAIVIAHSYRDVSRVSVLTARRLIRADRRHSSLVWLAVRVTRRSSRLSNVSGERRSVSSVCDVVLRDADTLTKRSLTDEVRILVSSPSVIMGPVNYI
jgi:hypothetical protein